MGVIFVPATDLDGVDEIGAAEHADETFHPLEAIDHRRSARRRDGERNRLGTIARADFA